MPNRIIRSDINRSERVNQLDAAEEVFYRRLLNEVDDHGLFDARTSILRATLFSLRLDRVREADITRWMAACQKAGLIVLYEAGGKPYLKVLNTRWQARSAPKYPLPPTKSQPPDTSDNNCKQLHADENNREQLPAIAPVFVDVVEDGDGARPRDSLSAFGVYQSVYGTQAPIYHQEAIENADIGDLELWRNCVADWKANRYSTRNISGLVNSYRERKEKHAKKAKAEAAEQARAPVVTAPANYRQPKPKEGTESENNARHNV